jgi:hypothetical protein
MSLTDREQANQAFLHAGVRWIRSLLDARVADARPSERRSPWSWRGTSSEPRSGAAARAARTAMGEAARADLPIDTLAARFGLTAFERDLLLLAVSAEIDTGIPTLMADAQGDAARRFPTFALAMSLFETPSWDVLSPERPLRAHRLVEIHQTGAVSLLAAPLRVDERVAAYVKGLDYLDERLAAIVTPLGDPGELPPSQETIALSLARWFGAAGSRGLVQLVGPHATAKADVVGRAAACGGQRAFFVSADALPSSADDLATFERLWSREALLQPVVLLVQGVDGAEPLAGHDGKPFVRSRWPRAFAQVAGPCLLDVRQALAEIDAPLVSVNPPTEFERRAQWQEVLTVDGAMPDQSDVLRLAGEFRTSVSQLNETARRASVVADRDGTPRVEVSASRAWQECVQRASAALAGVTRWIEPRIGLDEVHLPPPERAQLERLVTHARQRSVVVADFGFGERGERGLGLAALFHGESGTGKTLAAEAVARELGVGLAVTELATVQSKYIGETEKNLRRIFDAAEEGGAVLFFDEADALFGKRSEVKDSHDRYANIEINYLLMRMEQFRGVAILATNQKQAIDRGFVRRLRFIVGFPFPGVAERRAIWRSVFPVQTPRGDLDYDRLARFPLTGGSIFNAALGAAHGAAADGHGRVEMTHVLDAVKWELRKLEKPIAESEFRDLGPAIGGPMEVVA